MSKAKRKGRSVTDLLLSIRAENVLKKAGITTIPQLITWTEEDLGKLKNCGAGTVLEIVNALASEGFSLRPPEIPKDQFVAERIRAEMG
jgi:DNA-directed RNA polymerase alpha subunit